MKTLFIQRPAASFLGLALLATLSCSKNGQTRSSDPIDTSDATVPASGGDASVATRSDGSVASQPRDAGMMTTGPGPTDPTTVGADPNVKTGLPPLPQIPNVVASVLDDSVEIDFTPIEGARDYRVYALPKDEDIVNGEGGRFTIKNALYRCAGDRQTTATIRDTKQWTQGFNIAALVNQNVEGFMRREADSTLGYVYETAGDGRIPVYRVADPAPDADVDCDFQGGYSRWLETRVTRYITSAQERQMLINQRWRDDGIAFYVPASAGSTTKNVYVRDAKPRLYFVDGPEATARNSPTVAFQVLKDQAPGTVPLKRVHYHAFCGQSHDVLAAGIPAFTRARDQGDKIPNEHLHWSGLSGETTLVVEALAEGCPNRGFYAPISTPARDRWLRWYSLDDLRKTSPVNEVYVNAQHADVAAPRAIARSFLKVSPAPDPDMDFFEGFNTPDALGTLTNAPCGVPNCFMESRRKSDRFDISFQYVENDKNGMAVTQGELWTAYSDVGADVNGKLRITAVPKATLAADTFVHATMTVDSFTTLRRYPQIIISDQDAPVQYNMEKGYALVFQTFGGWPYEYELQVCDHQYWDVNNQCPRFDTRHVNDANDPDKHLAMLPQPVPGEHSGLDRGTRFDVYASTKRAYLFLDGQPFACADLPTATVPAGKVTVTFADVLYQSGVDFRFGYTGQDLQITTRRHFDNLGFSSGVPAPTWNEQIIPCTKHLKR